MMIDQYKNQYKKETEQIHAPAELIARTKAAVREEEARIRREFAVQTAGPEMKVAPAVSGLAMAPVSERKYVKRRSVRKWAYPLTAAAALLILASVSLMMRGLKSGDMSMSETPHEEKAVEMEALEMSGGEESDGGMAAAGAAMEMAAGEEAFADETVSAEADMAAAPASVAETEDMSESLSAAEDMYSDSSESEEMQMSGQQRKRGDSEKSLADNASATPVENGAQSAGAMTDTEEITIEKVINRPNFYGRTSTETHIWEGETFFVTREENGWAAYVEVKNGDGYVIRGEAEDLETFLGMGYQKLIEQE